MPKVIVIGGGAAGMLAAGTAAKNGAEVVIVEKNEKPGRKLMITGKGRCNVTNYCTELNALIKNVPTNGKFLYSAFSAFMPQDTMVLFEQLGVPLKTERGNRVFPVSDKAADIVDALKRYTKDVRYVHGTVIGMDYHDARITALNLSDGSKLTGDCFILASGGNYYPSTGSTGDGYRFAQALGHSIIEPRPSLVSLRSTNGFCPKMQGLTLKNVNFSLFKEGMKKPLYSELGEMLFTHFGVSGPLVLSASAHIRDFSQGKFYAEVDLKPGLSAEQLDRRLLRDFEEVPNKDFSNALQKLLPKTMVPVMVRLSGIAPDKKVNQISREERKQLIELFKAFRIELNGYGDIEHAIITSGGVSIKEIDPKTMRSKLYQNLFFAGEIIDVDAFTGGFNLQIAFSTGFVAGREAANNT